MADTHYRHPELGIAFEFPQGWVLELESANPRYPMLVSFRAGAGRVMVAARGATIATPSERSAWMKEELAGREIEATSVAGALSFPSTGNVAAVEFQIGGERQRWISMVANGIEFSFTHTGPYEGVRGGVEHVAATFRVADAEQARRFLLARAPKTPAEKAADMAALSHFQQVAARFHVPVLQRPRKKS